MRIREKERGFSRCPKAYSIGSTRREKFCYMEFRDYTLRNMGEKYVIGNHDIINTYDLLWGNKYLGQEYDIRCDSSISKIWPAKGTLFTSTM